MILLRVNAQIGAALQHGSMLGRACVAGNPRSGAATPHRAARQQPRSGFAKFTHNGLRVN